MERGICDYDFFREVILGAHEEIIRNMLLNNDAGEVNQYPIFMVFYGHDTSIPDLLAEPIMQISTGGIVTFRFLISGIYHVFFLNERNQIPPDYALFSTITPENKMKILNTLPGMGWQLIAQHFGAR